MLISISEYADMKGGCPSTIKEKCRRGTLTSARKIGSVWVVDSEEPYLDNRLKDVRASRFKSMIPEQSEDKELTCSEFRHSIQG